MRDNDNAFISQVVDFYYSTIDTVNPQGNMSAVADQFSITRAKVNKILITAGVIDSPLHRDIMALKSRGYDTEDIAAALGVSVATVKINMPYEKVIYNGLTKSAGAEYTERYRKREQIFLSNVVRKKTILEKEREAYIGNPANSTGRELSGEQDPLTDRADDSIHLMPVFSEEESKLFRLHPDVLVLHIELDADLSDVRRLAEIRYPSLLLPSRYTISRDILVPDKLPLHNLHYAINQAFGFTNSHLHEYTLSDSDLMWITEEKVSRWKKYIGLVFKNPVRDEDFDFWDDDYQGGSPKKWMRSKYTGPGYPKIFEESYAYAQEQVKGVMINSRKLGDLRREFKLNPVAVNEALPVSEILSEDGRSEYADIQQYDAWMKECVKYAARYPANSGMAQPFVYPFAETLHYSYDFGDDWNFTIKACGDVEYLVRQGRITAKQMREAIKDLCTLARPVVIAADGLPLVEDVGGVYGFKDFLIGISGLPSEMYEDKEESLAWAKSNGWSGQIGNLKTLL